METPGDGDGVGLTRPTQSVDNNWENDHVSRMPRKIRVEYPGAIHHVMSRGDRGEEQ